MRVTSFNTLTMKFKTLLVSGVTAAAVLTGVALANVGWLDEADIPIDSVTPIASSTSLQRASNTSVTSQPVIINVDGNYGLINRQAPIVTNIFQVEEGTLFIPVAAKSSEATSLTGESLESYPQMYVPIPIISTDVEMNVTGVVERTRITQYFVNTSQEWIDATYVFPVPLGAAVDELYMQIGTRTIEGVIQEKAQAKKTFNKAKAGGKKASLVEQKRPNLFTNTIANIGPGEHISITISYQNIAQYTDGEYLVRLPMTLSQRYAGELNSVDGSGESLDPVDPDYAHKQYAMDVVLTLNTQSADTRITSTTHHIESEAIDKGIYQVRLAEEDVANRDFVVSWSLGNTDDAVVGHYQEYIDGTTYGLIHVVPPVISHDPSSMASTVTPSIQQNTIFVLDSSGSMHGTALTQAIDAIREGVSYLTEHDTFNIVDFDSEARALWRQSQFADEVSKAEAMRFLRHVDSDGGTNMQDALALSLTQLLDSSTGLTQVIFVTDGSINNERELLKQIAEQLGDKRLFTVGIGAAPNSHFMEYAAMLGKGTYTYIDDLTEIQPKMAYLFSQLRSPMITDIQLTPSEELSLYPQVLPDIYLDQPVVLSYRYDGVADQPEPLTIKGRLGSDETGLEQIWSQALPVSSHLTMGLNKLWARAKIKNIESWWYTNTEYLPEELPDIMQAKITETALSAKIISRFTSLVAVDVTPSKPMGKQSKAVDVLNAKAQHLVGQLPQTSLGLGIYGWLGWIGLGFWGIGYSIIKWIVR